MLLGLGVAIVCIQAVALLEPPGFVSAILVVVVFLAWTAGALAMVGYVRWFFGAELSQAKRSKADPRKDGK